jgi:hypothetical protein
VTPEAQRIAIADACGWTEVTYKYGVENWCHGFHGNDKKRHPVPDYLSDLNAMHEAETTLTNEQWDKYSSLLADLVNPKAFDLSASELKNAVHATAAQRAEAFLRTLGKWDDTK